VVQRTLFDRFLTMYLEVARSLTFGHPLAVVDPEDDPPDLDFGPLINAAKVTELEQEIDLAIQMAATRCSAAPSPGLVPVRPGHLGLPAAGRLLDPPGASALGHAEPFGPVDTVVLVDSPAELLAEMNASNGCLVASIACDDEQLARQFAAEVHAFQGRHQQAPVPAATGRAVRGTGRLLEGRLSSAASCWSTPSTQGPPGEHLFGQLPRLPALPSA
jgi:acyl-CoA reductase-like NAD-dependent aldehyde dehydrogenase